MRRMMQVLTKTGEQVSPEFLDLLRWRFEALVMGEYPSTDSTSCLSIPYDFYMQMTAQATMGGYYDDRYISLQRDITVLLARNHSSFSGHKLTQRLKEMIIMLWMWGVVPGVPKRQQGMEEFFEANRDLLNLWIICHFESPYTYEIFHCLARAQAEAPNFISFWRTRSGGDVNPLFLEVLLRMNRLVKSDMDPSEHFTLINLLCQDIELGPSEDFIGYFTKSRLEYLHFIQDPCLQLLAKAVGGSAVESLHLPFIDVSSPWKESYTRIATCVFKLQENVDASYILPLCASLWNFAHEETEHLSIRAINEMNVLTRLENIFQCDMLCPSHLNGDGHLLLHVFNKFRDCKPLENMEVFTSVSKDDMVLDALLMILLLPEEYDDVSPEALGQDYGPIDPRCLSRLVNICKTVKRNQFTLLTLLADFIPKLAGHHALAAEDVEGISFCINKALYLPRDQRSVTIIPIVTTRLLECNDRMMDRNVRTMEENLVASNKAKATAYALKTLLASNLIFGGQNRKLLSCAHTHTEGNPASGWLSMNKD
ncbi:hypothetical protein M408DRAFT_326879 [Serendipita vermifera MAFF 305830]|uniref:Uncharacterized protein n=1 Tax=Serendipita vermifera MAFF 305830 TaxID=933852 RepID=A0A0C3BLB3_SERVB|nr:hypothetical protein M408DRAFT_326879 [Serendipita vermifera MAFF 305830]